MVHQDNSAIADDGTVKMSYIPRIMTDEVVTSSQRARLRRLPWWAWAAFAAGLLAVIILLWLAARRTTVTVAPVTRGRAVSAVYAPGTVRSGTQTSIAAAAAARIVAISVQRGSRVVPGQVVAQLDDTQARLQLESARRELETAQARLAQVSEPGDPYAVQQARAQLAQAQEQYRRSLNMVNAARARVRSANAQVAQASAAVRAAQSRVQTAQKNVRVQQQQRTAAQRQIGVAQAQVNRAQADLTNAQDNLTRQQALFAQGAVAERQVVQAQTAVSAAQATVEQAQANVQAVQSQAEQAAAAVEAAQGQVAEAQDAVAQARAAENQAEAGVNNAQAELEAEQAQSASLRKAIDAAQANLDQVQRGQRSSAVEVARADVRTAQARVSQAQDALRNYTVRSLVAGTVSDVPVEVGNFVPLGGAIAEVVSPRQLYVQADVDETDIGPVQIGQTAYFTTDALPEQTFQGVVTQIGASADPKTNTYPVEIRNIANSGNLRVNLSVDVNIVTSATNYALIIPASALVTTPQPHVWVVDSTSRLRQRMVSVGARDTAGGQVSIRSGLLEGELVVTNPQDGFREGQRVRIVQ